MYVCGPTVYDLPHIGHGRYNLVFDVLRRYLLFCGLAVRYVSNITDVDDNIIKRANEQGRTEPEVAAEFEARWWEAMDAPGRAAPRRDAARHGLHRRHGGPGGRPAGARRGLRDVRRRLPQRGPGAGLRAPGPQSLDSLQAGARVEGNDEKRSPSTSPCGRRPRRASPAGRRPGEPAGPAGTPSASSCRSTCSATASTSTAGGQDLAFPHHENERAQAVAEGRPFARHWVHNGWVEVEGTKMSKSLGNFTSLHRPAARDATSAPTGCWSCGRTTARPLR